MVEVLREFREEIVEPARLLPEILDWFCTNRQKFDDFCDLAGSLLGTKIKVQPRPADFTVSVSIGSETARAIEELGAGITEVLTTALAFTAYDKGLLLFEEPELHLHPTVQRRALDEIRRRCAGPWQAIITTHSNHILDAVPDDQTAIFATRREGDESRIEPVAARDQLSVLLDLLGVLPGSVLQANSVVWVEGPSDRLYYRAFLKMFDPELIENLHFTFAYFGGSLLRHQQAVRAPVEDLVNLLAVHPKSFVILDSDRTESTGDLGKPYAKQFIESSSDQERIMVTHCREVENYLPDEGLCWAVTNDRAPEVLDKIRAWSAEIRDFEPFGEQASRLLTALGRDRKAHDTSDSKKAEFALNILKMVDLWADVDWLGRCSLRGDVGRLAAFIRGSNHMDRRAPASTNQPQGRLAASSAA